MARGRPLLWSAIIGLPYLIIGGAMWLFEAVQPSSAGFPVMGFGLVALVVGVYLRSAAEIEAPPLREGEELLAARHPTQRVARAKFVISIPFLLIGLYILVETHLPYVYPTIPAAIGLWIYLSAANTYWANTVTTYYLTTERIIKEYRFFSLLREEIPLQRVRGVQERKGIIEKFVGLGDIRVASGGSEALELDIRDIEEATAFAEQIRNNI